MPGCRWATTARRWFHAGAPTVRAWAPVGHTGTLAAAPACVLVAGVLAGLCPTMCAARIRPVEALCR